MPLIFLSSSPSLKWSQDLGKIKNYYTHTHTHNGASILTFIAAFNPKGLLGEAGSQSDAGLSLGLLCQAQAGDREHGGVEFGPSGHFSW